MPQPKFLGSPLGWSNAELHWFERPAALDRLLEMGISQYFVAAVCETDVSKLERRLEQGYSARSFDYATTVFDRLHGLAEHMALDIGLSEPQITEFIHREPSGWSANSLVRDEIGGHRFADYPVNGVTDSRRYGHQLIEERLQSRFPQRYDEFVGRLVDQHRWAA